MRAALVAIGVMLAAAAPAQAEVVNVAATGFDLRFTQTVPAQPGPLWRALGRIGRWWDPEHTYSGDARRLSLALRAGGCFCETWGGASVEHARVILARPDELLRLQGGLGPLQELGVTGILTFTLAREAGGARLTLTYRVTSANADMTAIAPLVDTVLGQQFARLVRYAETGAPD